MFVSFLAAGSAFATEGDDFYQRLYARGIGQFNDGRYAEAYTSLRLAAFGLLEDVDQFETAQVYMTLAAMGLHRKDDARLAASRVVAAQRIDRRYGSLPLPAEIRQQFEAAAKELLTPDQLALLRGAPSPTATATNTTPSRPSPAPPSPNPPSGTDSATPQPRRPQPAPQPPTPMPKPAAAQPQTPRAAPPSPAPAPQSAVEPVTSRPQPRSAPVDITSTIAEAERAINSGDLSAARSLYRSVLESPQLTHALALRLGEGSYRSRDFSTAARAFERAGTLRSGEEQYHYYYAVALYETGNYAGAKKELSAALPFIEVTPDVERYRAKILGAIG